MRCPKCGYISFDSQQNCGKCGRDLGEIAALLEGTVSRHASPEFLAAALPPPPDDESFAVTADPDPNEIDLLAESIATTEETASPEEIGRLESDLEESVSEYIPEQSPGEAILPEEVPPTPAEPELVLEPEQEPAQEQEFALEPELEARESAAEDLLALEPEAAAGGSKIEPGAAGSPEDELDMGAVATDELFDLTGEESPDELDLSPTGPGGQGMNEATDLTDLLDLASDRQKPAPLPDTGSGEIEDITDLLGDTDRQAPVGDNLILEIADDDTPLGAATPSESAPDIPDLGLSLESNDDRDK